VAAEHGPAIDGAAVKAMTYTDAVVKEILRLHPIVGATFRRALHDFDLFGYHVPKVSISLSQSREREHTDMQTERAPETRGRATMNLHRGVLLEMRRSLTDLLKTRTSEFEAGNILSGVMCDRIV
jgi:hypothetical protein